MLCSLRGSSHHYRCRGTIRPDDRYVRGRHTRRNSKMIGSRLERNYCNAIIVLCLALFSSEAAAQNSVGDFYRGKTITLSVGFTAGGGYDLHARTLARVLANHVPGSPNVVVKNVPGAAGLVLA